MRAGLVDHSAETRLKRLAAEIDALAEKDEQSMRRAREIAALRRSAAAEIHGVCAAFVSSLRRLLSHAEIVLDPSVFSDSAFHDSGQNLFQIDVRGRIVQVEFESTPELLSTEDFRIPYALSGTVRAFNQALLDRNLIEENNLFYTVERHRNMWRFFDARTHRSGPFDSDYLIALMELLV